MIAGFGGGMLRDVLLNISPPSVFRAPVYWFISALATGIVLCVQKQHRYFSRAVAVCDALGLAFFTVYGIRVAESHSLNPAQCIAMGVITACFGGVIRDVIVNRVPYIFRSEIYATLAVVGGVIYFIMKIYFPHDYIDVIVIALIFIMRMYAILKKWHTPSTDLY
jgi:uncharacterized membrane protein YeiH